MLYNENLYYLLCFCTSLLFGKNIPEIWAKMLSAIQIAGFLNHFSRSNQWNSLIFWMVMQILKNQKVIETFLVGHGQKWMWPIWSLESKIYCWNCFLHAGAISHRLKDDWKFLGWAWSKIGVASLVMGL